MERVLALYEQGRAQEAQDVIRAGAGRNLMETIRQQISVMYNAERDLLDSAPRRIPPHQQPSCLPPRWSAPRSSC